MKHLDIGLDWLLARVREDEEGHLIWTGYIRKKFDQPQTRIDGRLYVVRRLIWELAHQTTLGKRWVISDCGIPGCVHPDHIIATSRSTRLAGIPKPQHAGIAIALTMRSHSNLSDEVIRKIRNDERPYKEIAAENGIHRSYVGHLKNNLKRRDFTNPFVGLYR